MLQMRKNEALQLFSIFNFEHQMIKHLFQS